MEKSSFFFSAGRLERRLYVFPSGMGTTYIWAFSCRTIFTGVPFSIKPKSETASYISSFTNTFPEGRKSVAAKPLLPTTDFISEKGCPSNAVSNAIFWNIPFRLKKILSQMLRQVRKFAVRYNSMPPPAF